MRIHTKISLVMLIGLCLYTASPVSAADDKSWTASAGMKGAFSAGGTEAYNNLQPFASLQYDLDAVSLKVSYLHYLNYQVSPLVDSQIIASTTEYDYLHINRFDFGVNQRYFKKLEAGVEVGYFFGESQYRRIASLVTLGWYFDKVYAGGEFSFNRTSFSFYSESLADIMNISYDTFDVYGELVYTCNDRTSLDAGLSLLWISSDALNETFSKKSLRFGFSHLIMDKLTFTGGLNMGYDSNQYFHAGPDAGLALNLPDYVSLNFFYSFTWYRYSSSNVSGLGGKFQYNTTSVSTYNTHFLSYGATLRY